MTPREYTALAVAAARRVLQDADEYDARAGFAAIEAAETVLAAKYPGQYQRAVYRAAESAWNAAQQEGGALGEAIEAAAQAAYSASHLSLGDHPRIVAAAEQAMSAARRAEAAFSTAQKVGV